MHIVITISIILITNCVKKKNIIFIYLYKLLLRTLYLKRIEVCKIMRN